MIDLGQALTCQDRRDSARHIPWASQSERALRNRAIETGLESDWQEWRAVRADRMAARI